MGYSVVLVLVVFLPAETSACASAYTVYAGLVTLQAGPQYAQAHSLQWGVQTSIFLL